MYPSYDFNILQSHRLIEQLGNNLCASSDQEHNSHYGGALETADAERQCGGEIIDVTSAQQFS